MTRPFYEFFCPVKIIAGYKAIEHVPFELVTRGRSRPMIVTDAGVRSAGLLAPVADALAAAELACGAIFDDVPQDGSIATVRAAAQAFRAARCDALIAIGGGSVIDTAKAVNLLVSEGGDDLLAYSGAHNLRRPLGTLVVVPTTAGTGSEVTLVAMVSDPDSGRKVPFTSHFLLPDAAVLDPRMTLALPAFATAMTAMDALTHAVEAFTCLAANPISDAYASAAVRKIATHLLPVMDHPGDAQGRLELAQASTMAGISFSNSMVGLVHSLGHALGAHAHLPHGVCMGLLLPYVLEYNLPARGERIGELLLPLAGPDAWGATPPAQRGQRAIDEIRHLLDALHARCGLPRTLAETGKVERAQLPAIAELAIDDGSIVFNPVETDRAELLGVLERAWH